MFRKVQCGGGHALPFVPHVTEVGFGVFLPLLRRRDAGTQQQTVAAAHRAQTHAHAVPLPFLRLCFDGFVLLRCAPQQPPAPNPHPPPRHTATHVDVTPETAENRPRKRRETEERERERDTHTRTRRQFEAAVVNKVLLQGGTRRAGG